MSVYTHFRDDEKKIIDYLTDLKRQVIENYYPKLSYFLTPREMIIAKTILGSKADIGYDNDGGYEQAERTRLLIYPAYYQSDKSDFELVLFKVNYAEKFNDIHHRQVLGSLMSLGIKREMIGDILVNNKHVQFITTLAMANYIEQHLQRIGKSKITLEQLPLTEIIVPLVEWQESALTVSNLRLDAIISGVLNISRSKSQALINKEYVKLNYVVVTDTSKIIEEGDLISIQGYGRCKLTTIGSRTRKDKIRIEVAKILKK